VETSTLGDFGRHLKIQFPNLYNIYRVSVKKEMSLVFLLIAPAAEKPITPVLLHMKMYYPFLYYLMGTRYGNQVIKFLGLDLV
jgi:hypothetical protein